MASRNPLSRLFRLAWPVLLLFWPEPVFAQRTALNWAIPYHGADKIFISKFLHNHSILGEWMGNGILKFDENVSVAYIDLNKNETSEMIVGAVHSSATCGGTAPDAGCPFYVFRKAFEKWELMGEVDGKEILITNQYSDGYRIIWGHYYGFRWKKALKRFEAFCLDHVKKACENPSKDESG